MSIVNPSRVIQDLVEPDQSGEHIFISSMDEQTEIVHRKTNRELEQKNRLKGYVTRFRIFNRHHMSVKTQAARGSETGFHFHLAFLEPKPRRRKRIAWRSLLWAGVLAGMLSAVLWLEQQNYWFLQTPFWGPATGLLGGATVLAVFFAVRRSRDRFVFVTRHGRVPLVFIDSRSPNRKEVDRFVEELSRRVADGAKEMWHDKRQFLCEELREHTRLKSEGIIPDGVFESAKARILQQHE